MAIGTATTSGELTATGPQTPKPPSLLDKTGQSGKNNQHRMLLAQHTGKGQHIDIMA